MPKHKNTPAKENWQRKPKVFTTLTKVETELGDDAYQLRLWIGVQGFDIGCEKNKEIALFARKMISKAFKRLGIECKESSRQM